MLASERDIWLQAAKTVIARPNPISVKLTLSDSGMLCEKNGSAEVNMHSVLTSLAAYVAAASLLTITPGLDTALVLRTAASGSPQKAALAGLGIVTGCLVWAALVALGLGALLAASQLAYTILRWIGAAYLLWVGYKMLRNPWARIYGGDWSR